MIWIKITECFAHGYGGTDYLLLDDRTDDELKEYMRERCEEESEKFYYTDKFRGYDWEKVESPSKEFLEKKISATKERIKSSKTYLLILEACLKYDKD